MQEIYERKKRNQLKETSWKQVKRHELNHEFQELDPLNFIEYDPNTFTVPAFTFNGDTDTGIWTTSNNADLTINGNVVINGQLTIIPNQETNQPAWEFAGMIPMTQQQSEQSLYIPYYTTNDVSIHTSGYIQVVEPET